MIIFNLFVREEIKSLWSAWSSFSLSKDVYTHLIERLRSDFHSMSSHALMMSLLFAHFALLTTLSSLKLVQFSTTSSFSIRCRFDFESLMKSSMILSRLFKFYYYCNKFYLKNLRSNNVLKRSMIEKYFNKSIDDKKLIFIKFNLIYWFEYWLFDVL